MGKPHKMRGQGFSVRELQEELLGENLMKRKHLTFFLTAIVIIFIFAGCGEKQYAIDNTETKSLDHVEAKTLFATYGFEGIINENPIDKDFSAIVFSGSTEQMIAENCRYRDHWKKEMEATCDKLSHILKEPDRVYLEKAQESWKSYMEENDSFRKSIYYEHNYEAADAGSLAKAFVSINQAEETRYRALELMEYLYSLANEVDFVYTGWDN